MSREGADVGETQQHSSSQDSTGLSLDATLFTKLVNSLILLLSQRHFILRSLFSVLVLFVLFQLLLMLFPLPRPVLYRKCRNLTPFPLSLDKSILYISLVQFQSKAFANLKDSFSSTSFRDALCHRHLLCSRPQLRTRGGGAS